MNAPDLKTLSVNDLVTSIKLRGAAGVVNGFTTPEGWPFTVVVCIGSPGNERAIAMAEDLHRMLGEVASFHVRVDFPKKGRPS